MSVIKKSNKKKMLIDVDGTFFNFGEVDAKIITEMFGEYKSIMLIDKIAWTFNRLDIAPNTFKILKLRLKFYCILSSVSFEKVIESYERLYKKAITEFVYNTGILGWISNYYNFAFVTANPWAKDVIGKTNSKCYYAKRVIARRKIFKEFFLNSAQNSVAIGNDITDIILAKKQKVVSVYIGNSIFRRLFKANYNFKTFEGLLEKIETIECKY